MGILALLVLLLAVILNSIDSGSMYEESSAADQRPSVPREETSSSSPADIEHSSDRSRSRSRSRSPPLKYPGIILRQARPPSSMRPPNILPAPNGVAYCPLGELEFIRLFPCTNTHRIFELRRYTFPANKPITLLVRRNVYDPMPTQEQIVLSASNGDVFALLESSNVLVGMYTYVHRSTRRAKINMFSGKVTLLSPEEVNASPVGALRPIKKYYRVELVDRV